VTPERGLSAISDGTPAPARTRSRENVVGTLSGTTAAAGKQAKNATNAEPAWGHDRPSVQVVAAR
jgi:hypothetical protein